MKRLRAILMLSVAVLLPVLARPQTAGGPGKAYVLKAARLFDGKTSALLKPGVVVVSGGKIVAVGSGSEAPAGAEIIDLGDATLLPGFIDAHTHLTMAYREDYDRAALAALQKPIPEWA